MKRSFWFLGNLAKWPLVWGGLATIGFLQLLRSGRIDNPLLRRYVDGHPIERIEVLLFFVGLVALLFKALSALVELRWSRAALLQSEVTSPEAPAESRRYLDSLARLPARLGRTLIASRLRAGLEYIHRGQSVEGLDQELRHLAESDEDRIENSYSFVRIVIWAIPILGFLGTVIGITEAIAALSPEALEQSLGTVTAGLGVAFDTTALALALTMVLMFVQYLTGRLEGRLLRHVEEEAARQLIGRFEKSDKSQDAQLVAIRRMSESVVASTERLVQKQADLWRESLRASQEHWKKAAQAGGDQFRDELNVTLAQALEKHAARLAELENRAGQANKLRWSEMQASLERLAAALTSQQTEMLKQGQSLVQAIDATNHIQKLESALNQNLATLAGSKNFEETVMSLAATINLLLVHLRKADGGIPQVQLKAEHGAKAA